MQIFVYCQEADKTIAIDVEANDRIDTVKAKIHDKEGCPPDQQVIFYDLICLDDCLPLSYYDIADGCCLSMILELTLHFAMISGKIITMQMMTDDSIAEFKEKIYDEEGIPPHQQQLSFAGQQLENHRHVWDYNIQHESTINLVLTGKRLRQGVPITASPY